MILEDTHVFQGMRRGNHQLKQAKEFLWDAHNIRITDKEDNTLFSITNEKGTSGPLVTLKSKYVGHCVLNNTLIVFTGMNDQSQNYIYKIQQQGNSYEAEILFYREEKWDYGWTPLHPIEAFGVYESQLAQKVYWVDGINQPRVINITKDRAQYDNNEHPFDFVQTLKLQEQVSIEKLYGEGTFTPGTIQYAFTYYNR